LDIYYLINGYCEQRLDKMTMPLKSKFSLWIKY